MPRLGTCMAGLGNTATIGGVADFRVCEREKWPEKKLDYTVSDLQCPARKL